MNKLIQSTLAGIALLLALSAPGPAFAKGVVLNFSDVDISTMVKFISDLTGKNFVMDDRVKGKISVFSPTKLTPEEAFNVFTSVLELKGFSLVHAGKVYKVVPTSAAKQSGMTVLSDDKRGPVNESYVAQVIELERISAQDAVAFLQPIVSKDGYISSFGPANMLLVVDSSLSIQKILGILQLIDTDQHRDKPELVFLKNAGADNVAKVIQEWLRSKDKSAKSAAPAAGAGIIIPDVRLNALIVFGTDKDKEDVKKLVALIDIVPPSTSSKINVYYLEYADATDVGKVLDGVVKGVSLTAAPQGGGATPLQPAFEAGKVSITPDKATNSLVVMASPTDYQNLLQVIQKLDKRRRQVFVQALIAEVSIDKLRDLGLHWGLIGGGSNGTASVIGTYDPHAAFTDALNILTQLTTAGITIPNLTGTPMNFAASLKALDTTGAVNVLSTPNILTSDNKEAEIFVGENVPFITSTSVVTGGIAQQSVTRQDTGITLKITPQISEGEYVKLDVYQEISAVKENKGQATDLVTTKRSAKTSIVVKDKDTVVIGGLIQDQDIVTDDKIPFLGDIPLLGRLFQSTHKERSKTNLMIVLTPRIVRGAQEMAEVTAEKKKAFTDAVQGDAPFSLDRELQQKP